MTVTLVQVFEVPEGREEEFLDKWVALTESLKSAAGFYGTRLLRRTSDRVGTFAFVNIASWESAGAWLSSTSRDTFQALLPAMKDFDVTSGVYEVVYEQGDI